MAKRNMIDETAATVGIDLGDKTHFVCVLDRDGNVLREGSIAATAVALEHVFGECAPLTIAIETGTHSPWVSRMLEGWGHRVLVANARKLRMIYRSDRKSDVRDAQMLARIARMDPELLSAIHHRGPKAQADLAVLKSRDALVKARTALIGHARGTVKAMGARLPSCSAASFHKRAKDAVPASLHPALGPVLATIEDLTVRIRGLDKQVEALCQEAYPDTENLRTIHGVGPITALGFILTIEEPERFARSRDVAVYLGLVPRRDQSGSSDKQLRISKAGGEFLRRLLVSCAHYILGCHGTDSDLRRWGLRLCARGGKNARKRAVVAVARKLAVHLHALWVSGEPYEPLRHAERAQAAA